MNVVVDEVSRKGTCVDLGFLLEGGSSNRNLVLEILGEVANLITDIKREEVKDNRVNRKINIETVSKKETKVDLTT